MKISDFYDYFKLKQQMRVAHPLKNKIVIKLGILNNLLIWMGYKKESKKYHLKP